MTSRLLLIALALIASVAAVAQPAPFRAEYKADYKGVPINAVGIRELRQHEDGSWELTSTAKAAFLAKVVESTRFGLDDAVVEARRYNYRRSGIGRKKTVDLSFDWENGTARQTEGKRPWEVPIESGTYDRLLYQYQMQSDLIRARDAGEGWPRMHYVIADDGRLRTYDFEVTGTEVIETPVGKMNTIKAIRIRENSTRETTFWLSPEHDFMLVRFRQIEDDGKGFELLLREAVLDGEPVSGE